MRRRTFLPMLTMAISVRVEMESEIGLGDEARRLTQHGATRPGIRLGVIGDRQRLRRAVGGDAPQLHVTAAARVFHEPEPTEDPDDLRA